MICSSVKSMGIAKKQKKNKKDNNPKPNDILIIFCIIKHKDQHTKQFYSRSIFINILNVRDRIDLYILPELGKK